VPDRAAPTVEPWLSAAEVAALVGMSSKTVRTWARAGRLPGVRFGGRDWKFRASDVERVFEQALAAAQPPAPAARRRPLPTGLPAPAPSGLTLTERFKRRRQAQAEAARVPPRRQRA
jgi:excisionase family DNA binding protein